MINYYIRLSDVNTVNVPGTFTRIYTKDEIDGKLFAHIVVDNSFEIIDKYIKKKEEVVNNA